MAVDREVAVDELGLVVVAQRGRAHRTEVGEPGGSDMVLVRVCGHGVDDVLTTFETNHVDRARLKAERLHEPHAATKARARSGSTGASVAPPTFSAVPTMSPAHTTRRSFAESALAPDPM